MRGRAAHGRGGPGPPASPPQPPSCRRDALPGRGLEVGCGAGRRPARRKGRGRERFGSAPSPQGHPGRRRKVALAAETLTGCLGFQAPPMPEDAALAPLETGKGHRDRNAHLKWQSRGGLAGQVAPLIGGWMDIFRQKPPCLGTVRQF